MPSNKKGKANIKCLKPEAPAFLQRMKEEIASKESDERRERCERRRKLRSERFDDPEDAPAIVKVDKDGISEEEYKRMKKSFDLADKSDETKGAEVKTELDIDQLIEQRTKNTGLKRENNTGRHYCFKTKQCARKSTAGFAPRKTLSYSKD